MKRFSLTQLIYTLLFMLSALWLGWIALAQTDFLYPINYDFLKVDEHIAKYAPQNRYRKYFEHTDKEQRLELFSEIIHAIRHDAGELTGINYKVIIPQNQLAYSDTLLHKEEVAHLTDVYNLISSGERLGLFVFTIWLMSSVFLLRVNFQFFNRQAIISLVTFIAIVCFAVIIIGPVKVFYWLHTVAFPPENPWFFYYQDSLMTTVMKAPDLFIAIGTQWLVLSLLIIVVGIVFFKKIALQPARKSHI